MLASQAARRRGACALATVAVILAGLASRRYPALFPAALALGISYVLEFTQLYQADWINAIRATTAGHLVLGAAFGWADLLAYTAGAALGAAAELAWRARGALGRF